MRTIYTLRAGRLKRSGATARKSFLGLLPLLAVGFLLFGAPRAFAKAGLASSTPASGSVAPAGTTSVVLMFTEEVSANQTTVRLLPAGAEHAAAATTQVDPLDHKKLTLACDPLAQGHYTVRWSAVSEKDGATTQGEFTFEVGAGASSTSAQTPAAGTASATIPTAGQGGAQATATTVAAGAASAGSSSPLVPVLAVAVVVLLVALVVQNRMLRRQPPA